MRQPELLAPAGSLDALFAAMAGGADAVYVGLGALNARAANAGLSLDELAVGCALAHAHGARVYVALNVYVYDRELDEAVELAGRAFEVGADALIVADAGLCLRLREALPSCELHLSTQAGVQNAEAVAFAARELGVDRVTCARELGVVEQGALCATGVPIEAFCHGAICVCYSGACSYSALLRGRSANRGDCTQPCRLAYELRDAAGNVVAGGSWKHPGERASDAPTDGDRLLCPRDYLGIRHIPALLEAGVASFKIEGRMKGADYVCNVVRCYRTALDAALRGRPLDGDALDELEAQLARSFSRGFTDGYLRGDHAATGADHMSFERAINQGLPVGELVSLGYDEVVVGLTRPVAAGDQLEIRSTPGADAPADVPKRWPIVVCPRDGAAGERLTVHCKRKVVLGSAVHVVRSAGVVAEAARAVEAMRAEAARLCPGFAPSEAGGPDGVEKARVSTKPAGEDAPTKCPESVPLVPVLDGAAIDFGEVCRARDYAALGVVMGSSRPGDCPDDRARRGETGLEPVRAHLDGGDSAGGGEGAVRAGVSVGHVMLCRNYGQVVYALEHGIPWEAASPISVWNARTACWLLGLGAQRIWLPEELDTEAANAIYREVERRAGAEAAARLALPKPGSTPLMITEHCLLTAEGPCSNACATCPRRAAANNGDRYLVELDRNAGAHRLRVEVDESGRTRLYR